LRIGKLLYCESVIGKALATPPLALQHCHWYAATRFAFSGGKHCGLYGRQRTESCPMASDLSLRKANTYDVKISGARNVNPRPVDLKARVLPTTQYPPCLSVWKGVSRQC